MRTVRKRGKIIVCWLLSVIMIISMSGIIPVSATEADNNPNGDFYAYVPYTPNSSATTNSPATTYGFQTPKTGIVNLQFDVTPSADSVDGYVGFTTTNWVDGLANTKVGIILQPDGQFAANNGGTQTLPATSITYSKDTTYTIAMTIDIAKLTYSATVNGKELAKDFAFRSSLPKVVNDISTMAVTSHLGSFKVTNISEKLVGLVDNDTIGMDETNNPAKFKDANAYFVGPSHKYKKVQDVIALLKAGDMVYLAGDATYPAALYFDKTLSGTIGKPITIKGISINGKKPIIKGIANYAEIRCAADNYVLDNIEIAGNLQEVMARFPGVNYDTIMVNFPRSKRVEITAQTVQRGILHESNNLVVRNCSIHETTQGILSNDIGSGSITVEYCDIYRNGERDGQHNLYLATDESLYPNATLRVQYNYIHDATSGNGLKTRGSRNEIYYNYFENNFNQSLELIGPDPNYNDEGTFETAEAQRAVNPAYGDLYVREDSEIIGNVIIHEKGSLVRVGGDGTSDLSYYNADGEYVLDSDGKAVRKGPMYGQSYGRYRFVNNTFIDYGASDSPDEEAIRAIRVEFGVESVEMYNNVFYKPFGSPMSIAAVYPTPDMVGAEEWPNDARWASGTRQFKGANNWVQTNAINVPDSSEWTGTITGTDPGFTNASSAVRDFTITENSPLKGAGISLNKTVATWPDWTNTLYDYPAGSPIPDFDLATYTGTPVTVSNIDNSFPNPMMKVGYIPTKTMTAVKRPIRNAIDIGAFPSTVYFKRAK